MCGKTDAVPRAEAVVGAKGTDECLVGVGRCEARNQTTEAVCGGLEENFRGVGWAHLNLETGGLAGRVLLHIPSEESTGGADSGGGQMADGGAGWGALNEEFVEVGVPVARGGAGQNSNKGAMTGVAVHGNNKLLPFGGGDVDGGDGRKSGYIGRVGHDAYL